MIFVAYALPKGRFMFTYNVFTKALHGIVMSMIVIRVVIIISFLKYALFKSYCTIIFLYVLKGYFHCVSLA